LATSATCCEAFFLIAFTATAADQPNVLFILVTDK
jgi:hypothetical protein